MKSDQAAAAEKAIRATATAFVDAFDNGNANSIAQLWTADGSLADESGHRVKGRAAIEAKYAEFFKQYPGAKIRTKISSIEFPATGVAVEDGVTELSTPDGATGSSRYTAVHTLVDGKWLMASVRETSNEPTAFSNGLEAFSGLIGQWVAHADDATFHSDFHWIADKRFIQRDYTTRERGKVTATGTQIIGYDPRSNQIRSWSFDSSGGHGTGLWQPTADGWRIESRGVRTDGVPTASVDRVIRPAGQHGIVGWRSSQRRAGTMLLPDSDEIVFDRVPQQQKTGKVETR